MKTQQELMQAYLGPGGTVDMVKEYNAKHGTNIQPWECVRTNVIYIEDHPMFDDGFEYTFSLTILYDDKRKEHRPVFAGDKVYDKKIPKELEVIDSDTLQYGVLKFTDLDWDRISWNPPAPKRTFNLGDLEFSCTANKEEGYKLVYIFDSAKDRDDVEKALNSLLVPKTRGIDYD